jgi:hypothetical protein
MSSYKEKKKSRVYGLREKKKNKKSKKEEHLRSSKN